MGNTASQERWTVFPINGLAKEEEKGDEKDFSLRSK